MWIVESCWYRTLDELRRLQSEFIKALKHGSFLTLVNFTGHKNVVLRPAMMPERLEYNDTFCSGFRLRSEPADHYGETADQTPLPYRLWPERHQPIYRSVERVERLQFAAR